MDVIASTLPPVDLDADTVAIGLFDGKAVSHDLPGGTPRLPHANPDERPR